MILPTEWYEQRDTIAVARDLLGKYIVHESNEGITVGRIVETEAYLGVKDPASHGFNGKSLRTQAMFGEPGHAYIYFTYGMHYCFNVTTAPEGVGEAVLIRALEPIEGIGLMEKRRRKSSNRILNLCDLCSGPAKLVTAMGITKDLYSHDLTKPPLFITNTSSKIPEEKTLKIITSPRIGITRAKDLPLRFYIKESEFVSGRKRIRRVKNN